MTERTFADRLRLVIGEEKPTPWAQARGLSATTIHDWLVKGMQPYPKSLAKLVAATGIPADWWESGDGSPPVNADEVRYVTPEATGFPQMDAADGAATYQAWAESIDVADFVPVRYYRSVAISAGGGALNQDHEPDALMFSRRFIQAVLGASPDSLLLVRVKGDSMYPTLQAKWTVMVDTAKRTITSGIYVVRIGDQEVCKRLEARPGGVVKVISDNRLYDEYEIDTGRVTDAEFNVLGQVVWFAGLVG